MSDTYNFGHAGCRPDCQVCFDERWGSDDTSDENREDEGEEA